VKVLFGAGLRHFGSQISQLIWRNEKCERNNHEDTYHVVQNDQKSKKCGITSHSAQMGSIYPSEIHVALRSSQRLTVMQSPTWFGTTLATEPALFFRGPKGCLWWFRRQPCQPCQPCQLWVGERDSPSNFGVKKCWGFEYVRVRSTLEPYQARHFVREQTPGTPHHGPQAAGDAAGLKLRKEDPSLMDHKNLCKSH